MESRVQAPGLSRKGLAGVFLCLLLPLLSAHPAYAKGKGPVGVWPASERYALVADSSLPGLVLVDLQTGAAVDRKVFDKGRPVGVASCQDCRFVLISGGNSTAPVTGGNSSYWLLHLEDTVSSLLRKDGTLALSTDRLEPLDIHTAKGRLTDGRMVLVSDDGKAAFVASSEDHVVVRVNVTGTPAAVVLFSDDKAKPYGLNWDRKGALLVSMHKRTVWRMTVDGEVQAIYDTNAADCPGARELKPNLRAAIDDPVNEGSLLILASNPLSYDAVVWRLTVDAQGKQSCINVAGRIGRDPGWVDASGEAIEFSRPHYFSLRPDSHPPQLIITDIDNRVLRLLDLATYASTTVMYHQDQVLQARSAQQHVSKASCAELQWQAATVDSVPQGWAFCVRPPQAKVTQLTQVQAQAQCSAEGARLCEPAELLAAGMAPNMTSWTAAECSSCWQRTSGERCALGADHKTADLVHADKGFSQAWHSGFALVVGPAAGRPSTTICRPVDDTLRAAAPCCADVATLATQDKAPTQAAAHDEN